ncbi:MAG TPA: hypothetical protein VMB19_08630 [Silvibacterium sp.]|nr:hypothetical protein [Silvibacterium sp.]
MRISADSPRPLEQALDGLQQKYKWAVDYEDPRYTSRTDLRETDLHTWLPAGGSFTADLAPGTVAEDEILQSLVDTYNHSQNPGRFELRRQGSGFAVVGTAARDEKGEVARQRVLLDAQISLVRKQRTVAQTIDAICREVSLRTHIKVAVAVSPTAVLGGALVSAGGRNATARDLLAQSLAATHHNLYWRLLFDPNSRSYFLDIHSL